MKTSSKIYLWDKEKIPGYNPDIQQEMPHMTASYPEDKAKIKGAILVCPGGGYWMHYAAEGAPVADWLNSLGFVTFLLSYRYAPYRFPYPLLDAQRGLRLIRANSKKWGYAGKPIGIIGSSAGGHLAAMTGIFHNESGNLDETDKSSSKPDFMILCYPVISFGKYRNHYSMTNLIGKKPDRELRKKLSLENSVTAETTPAFIWQTANDETVPVENSILFAGALKKKKVPFSLHIFPEGRHGLGVTNERPDVHLWTTLCKDWLSQLT